jgi:hypothetical protein
MQALFAVEQVAVAGPAYSVDTAHHFVVMVVKSSILSKMESDLLMPGMSARKRTVKDMPPRSS